MSLYSDYDLTPAPPPGPMGFGTLKPYNPTWSERLGAGFANAMDWLRGSPSRQGWQNASDIAQNVAGLVPGLGQALSANQGYRSAQQGNVPGAVAGAIGALPLPIPGLKGVLAEGAEPIGRAVSMEGGTPGILAYHGSQHDFPAFDISKIGTGEGAQVYGHGLYFAQHPETAEGYKTAGMGVPDDYALVDKNGDEVKGIDWRGHEGTAAEELHNWDGDYEGARGALQEYHDTSEPEGKQFWQDAIDQLHSWEKEGYMHVNADDMNRGRGHKYQVSIAEDPDRFLDWDKPFDDQHPDVQKFFRDAGIISNTGKSQLTGEDLHELLVGKFDNLNRRESLSAQQAADYNPHAAAMEDLKANGIPGIKYRDAGSRDDREYMTPPAATLVSDLPSDVQSNLKKSPWYMWSNKDNPSLNAIHDDISSTMENRGKLPSDAHNLASKVLIDAGVELTPKPRTYNFVLNNDKNINILKKYALPVGGAMTLPAIFQHAHQQGQDTDQYQMSPMSD